jgi:biopolymer transport protein ExbD
MTNKDNQSTKQELNLVPLVAIIAPIATILVVALPLLTG